MPYVIGDDLVIRVLLDESDGGGAFFRSQVMNRSAAVIHGSFSGSCRGKFPLRLSEKSGLAAARRAAEYRVGTFFYGKGDVYKLPAGQLPVMQSLCCHTVRAPSECLLLLK